MVLRLALAAALPVHAGIAAGAGSPAPSTDVSTTTPR